MFRFFAFLGGMTLLLVCVSHGWAAEHTSASKTAKASSSTQALGRSPALAGAEEKIDPKCLREDLLTTLIVRYTNCERQKAGLKPLSVSAQLAQLAQAHSLDMARRDYFSHSEPKLFGHKSFSSRMPIQQLNLRQVAENIAMFPVVKSRKTTERRLSTGQLLGRSVEEDIYSYDALARQVVENWMQSPGHRKNILAPQLDEIAMGFGLGQHKGQSYVYITQDFGGR